MFKVNVSRELKYENDVSPKTELKERDRYKKRQIEMLKL